MPRWTYFITIERILSDTSTSCSESNVHVNDGTPLQWDSTLKRVTTWGSPLWWRPHDLVASMLSSVGSDVRLRLAVTGNLYGFHIDINTTRFFDNVNSIGEVSVCRILSVWESNACVMERPPLLIDSVPTNLRKCRRKLTPMQAKALDWMRAREVFSGSAVPLATGVNVKNSNFTFSFRDRMFVDRRVPQTQHVVVNSAALTGYRGTGKSMIVRDLVSKSLNTFLPACFPRYVHHANLIVVPDHLIDQWTDVLESPLIITSESDVESWHARSDPVVLMSYSTMIELVHKNQKAYPMSITDHIARRKGIRDRSIVSVTWDRIIVDEFCTNHKVQLSLKHMSWQFLWVLQGGTTTRDEMNIVDTLYTPETAHGEILSYVVYNYFPVVVPLQNREYRVVDVMASPDEVRLMESLGDRTGDWVYPRYNNDMFSVCDTWEGVLDMPVGESVGESVEIYDTEDWLYPENYPERTMTVSIDGVEITLAVNESSEESSEESEDDEEVVVCEEFLMSQVDKLMGGEVPQCVVCLDRVCDTIMGCGHTVCFICATSITHSDPKCPQCRLVLDKVCVVGGTFTHSALVWIANEVEMAAANSEKIIVVGDDQEGVERVRRHIPCVVHSSDLNGKVESDVAQVIVLDKLVNVPDTIQCRVVSEVRVKFPDAAM